MTRGDRARTNGVGLAEAHFDAGADACPDATGDALFDRLALLLPAAALAFHPLDARDLPLHLGIGEWVLEHGTLPATDPFSLTVGGTPWVPHEWLLGVLFALVERSGGATGLTLLCALGAMLFAWVLRGLTRTLGTSAAAHLALSVPLWLMLGRRIILRPHLFAMALPFALWWILLRARQRPRLAWLAPPLLLLWVNLHGSFLLGFGILGLDLVVCGRGHPLPLKLRLGVLGAGLATLLGQVHAWFQPEFFAGVVHAIGIVSDPVYHDVVQEWRAPFADALFRRTLAFPLSLAWIALAAAGLARRRGLPLSYLLFAAVSLALYLRHQRFLALVVPATLPLVALPPGVALPIRLARGTAGRNLSRAAAALTALLFLTVGYPYAWGVPPRPSGLGWSPRLPLEIFERGRRQHPSNLLDEKPGVFCEYGFGGCVIRAGAGKLKPTMDGRNSIYPGELYLRHREALERPGPFREELLENVGAVLVSHPAEVSARSNLIERLQDDPRWLWRLTKPRRDEPYLLFLKHRR